MKTIRALVVDDEPLALRRVHRAIEGIEGVEVIGSASDGVAALEAVQSLRPDLVFLDIMMPGFNGFEMLRKLDDDEVPAVIFVTAYDHFAVGAFEEGAVDYLLKPLDDERLRVAVERARARLQETATRERIDQLRSTLARINSQFDPTLGSQYERDLWVRENGKVSRVRVEDIHWIEAAGDYVSLHTRHGRHLADDSIQSLASRLDSRHFMRVHRRTIVRLNSITGIKRERFSAISLELADESTVRVSKSYKRDVMSYLDQA